MRSKLVTGCAAAVVLATAGAAAAGNGGFAPVEPYSPNAQAITDSWWFVVAFTGAIFLIVEVSLLAFVVRFRRRGRRADAEGPQIRGNTNLELVWTVVPVLILAAIGTFVFAKLPSIRDVPSASAAGGRLDVKVKGYRFYWQFEYPNGVIALDRLRAPVGQAVRLEITAPEFDVIHSWWIPALGGKFDAIPGKTNVTWFKAREARTYEGQCAEFCGAQHAAMLAAVEAMPPEEFERWLAEQAEMQGAGESGLGEETYRAACAKCHGQQGEGLIGPALTGSALVTNKEAVETTVRNGRRQMPPVGKDWSDRQMDALTAYLEERFAGGG